MAWVPAVLAEDGAEIQISVDGRVVPGTVRTAPFWDPDGERQRA
jgi:glycine cleavage system aminomethyltransferase T